MMRRLCFLTLAIFIILVASTQSQGTNLLTNPGFEPPYSNTYQRKVANGWTAFVISGSTDFYGESFGSIQAGSASQAILSRQDTFLAGVYQRVTVPANAIVQGSAFGSVFVAGSEDYAVARSRLRVGIDPNGGTNPNASGVVWSNEVTSAQGVQTGLDSWQTPYLQMSVEATATGEAVTLFLWGTQQYAAVEHRHFWDSASLVVKGEGQPSTNAGGNGTTNSGGGSAPPPEASFVNPQGARSDGSIVHTVQQGNTLSAIAVAYGIPMDKIIELNNIIDARLLRVGQELLIRPAAGSQADSTEDEKSNGSEGADDQTDPTPQDEEEEIGRSSRTPRPPRTSRPSATKKADDEVVSIQDESIENKLTQTPIQELTPTPQPVSSPTPTSIPTEMPPAPVDEGDGTDGKAVATTTSVCVSLFDDVNQNRIFDTDENLLAGGIISLQQGGTDIDAILTDGSADERCFDDLPPGEYVAIASAPAGFGLTTPDQLRLRAQLGDRLTISFGAAANFDSALPPISTDAELRPETTDDSFEDSENDNRLLQYVGVIVLILAGLVFVGGTGTALLLRRR